VKGGGAGRRVLLHGADANPCADPSQNARRNHIREINGTGIEVRHPSARAEGVRDRLADLTRAADLLGYRSAVGLPEGLRRTVGSLRGSTGPGMEKKR